MKIVQFITVNIFCLFLCSTTVNAEAVFVTSQQEFDFAHDSSADTIIWRDGTYSNVYMDISNNNIFIAAETLGATIFTGESRIEITGDDITFQGFQYLDGDVKTRDVISIRGDRILITQINIQRYRSYKYLRVRESSEFVDITYCNFENRLNLDDQNILSILVHETNPGYHKIQYCSFKNFDGTGNDLGIEPIRIGLSTQANRISRTLVEYCYFTKCDGDGEIISSKASENVYRFNTFEDNPKAELVLRHGSKAIVYGNFFLHGKGGIRVREGQNHYIYNNYFFDLEDRPIYLQNESSDPLANINIAFNTIINSAEVRLGGSGSNPPTNVVFANNIIENPKDNAFREATGTETWIRNMISDGLGITMPTSGIELIDPQLTENSQGFWGLSENSTGINAAQPGYKLLPEFEGIAAIDAEISFDLMGQNRPSEIAEKDLGCNEFPHTILIQPFATEDNTGPIYNMPMTTSVSNNTLIVEDFIQIHPNPVGNQLHLTIHSPSTIELSVVLYNLAGKNIATVAVDTNFLGDRTISKNITTLPAGTYTVQAIGRDRQEGVKRVQTIKFVKAK